MFPENVDCSVFRCPFRIIPNHIIIPHCTLKIKCISALLFILLPFQSSLWYSNLLCWSRLKLHYSLIVLFRMSHLPKWCCYLDGCTLVQPWAIEFLCKKQKLNKTRKISFFNFDWRIFTIIYQSLKPMASESNFPQTILASVFLIASKVHCSWLYSPTS